MKERMIIGFDAKRIVRNRTGLGSYGRTLVNDLSLHDDLQLRLYAPDAGHDDMRLQVKDRPNLTFCYPEGHLLLGKSYWRSRSIVSQLQRDGVQIYHGLSGELPTGIRHSGIRSVVTIHDLIFMRHPEYYHWIDTKLYEWKFRQAIREADSIVAISECTRRDICELGNIDEDRVTVIYQSCAPRFSTEPDVKLMEQVRRKYRLPRRFILNVGSIEERKNVLLAVRALHHLPEDVSLVVVGRRTGYTEKVRQYADSHILAHRVFMLQGITDEELPAFYHLADAFVYPSRYEGFGIPIIEAISAGLPVVACTGSCLEEAGGPDSLYVDPDADEDFAAAVGQVLSGAPGRQQRIERSQEYITRFRNADAAGHFVSLYSSLPFLQSSGRSRTRREQ